MTLLDAARLLHDSGRFLASHDLGVVEATLIAVDSRGDVPTVIGVTDENKEVRVPIHKALALGGAA